MTEKATLGAVQSVAEGATLDAFMVAAREAQAAAWGDSNDDEIDLLRDALGQACELLGVRLPEVDDTDAEGVSS